MLIRIVKLKANIATSLSNPCNRVGGFPTRVIAPTESASPKIMSARESMRAFGLGGLLLCVSVKIHRPK